VTISDTITDNYYTNQNFLKRIRTKYLFKDIKKQRKVMKKVRDDYNYKMQMKDKIAKHKRKLKTVNKLLEKKLFVTKKEA